MTQGENAGEADFSYSDKGETMTISHRKRRYLAAAVALGSLLAACSSSSSSNGGGNGATTTAAPSGTTTPGAIRGGVVQPRSGERVAA